MEISSKSTILMLSVFLAAATCCIASTKGDDHQLGKLIDCQSVLVEPMLPVHVAKTVRTCFYTVVIGAKGLERELILVVPGDRDVKPYYLSGGMVNE